MKGYVAIVLHAHLPWVRHPEHERPIEERWLHEALWESYLPLCDMLDRLAADGISARITVSVSPTLAAMLADPLLKARFVHHLDRLDELLSRERARFASTDPESAVVAFYGEHLSRMRAVWERIGGDVLRALVQHADAGAIELLTTSATHAYLPALSAPSVRAQLRLGQRSFEALSGRSPRGLWLPECGYDPLIANDLAAARVGYTVLDAHGLELALPRPTCGTFAPVLAPNGVAFFGRDTEASREVWSRETGYPGHPSYRDFYRDVGFDRSAEELGAEVGPFGTRLMTGLKYHRITGLTEQKEIWCPGTARAQAKQHAAQFVAERSVCLGTRAGDVPKPIVVAPYDAELFGHWWFEGPWFLEEVLRALDARAHAGDIAPITLLGYLEQEPALLVAEPAGSSWGEGGFGQAWLGPSLAPSHATSMSPAHVLRHIRHAEASVQALVRRRRSADGLAGQALEQAIRELLLLEASDWGFMLRRGEMAEYAASRVRVHARRVDRLCRLAEREWFGDEEISWIKETCEHTPFLAALRGEQIRDAFDGWGLKRRAGAF